ncbi:uncharacterized protein LOC122403005 isoform X2 [Colletes gigas]|uniref:uncharacterized protein LOC122403005 isoform X2 n=1 Tax=Colletes gigas TaxID=935657 RepID=UPI001C9BAE6B|nr:uncharacterized protein LOC122403005 isoform X2 [Colletes gigas]
MKHQGSPYSIEIFVNIKMNLVSTVLIISSLYLQTLSIVLCDRCCRINSRKLPDYKLIRSNVRSNQLILSRTTVRNINECKQFSSAKKALAFNYGLETDHQWNVDAENKSGRRIVCQALQCPEIHKFTSFVPDKNYKYYSMYSSHISTGGDFSLVCIPRTGVFLFSNNDLSYSQAQISCQKMNASIAHIISEQRTNELAKYILQNTSTFIGLSNRDHENIWKNEFGEPLACFKYRAWAEGEPSHWKGCVGLFRPSESRSGPFWKVLSCDSTLPFICEIPPM